VERRPELIGAAALALGMALACGKSAPPPGATPLPGAIIDAAPVSAPAPEAADAPPPAPATIADVTAAGAAVGQVVRVEGTARNAKLSAVVMTGELVVYCLDLPSWPDERANQPVVVRGLLEHTSEFEPEAGGPISAGTGGPIYAIRTCAVE
jgi:hypothetical protein